VQQFLGISSNANKPIQNWTADRSGGGRDTRGVRGR